MSKRKDDLEYRLSVVEKDLNTYTDYYKHQLEALTTRLNKEQISVAEALRRWVRNWIFRSL